MLFFFSVSDLRRRGQCDFILTRASLRKKVMRSLVQTHYLCHIYFRQFFREAGPSVEFSTKKGMPNRKKKLENLVMILMADIS